MALICRGLGPIAHADDVNDGVAASDAEDSAANRADDSLYITRGNRVRSFNAVKERKGETQRACRRVTQRVELSGSETWFLNRDLSIKWKFDFKV
jgi:hypothetical protein